MKKHKHVPFDLLSLRDVGMFATYCNTTCQYDTCLPKYEILLEECCDFCFNVRRSHKLERLKIWFHITILWKSYSVVEV